MNGIQTLERAASAAFDAGIGWNDFWDKHAAAIKAVYPYNRERFRRLVNRLLSLVASGDTDGMMPLDVDDTCPWVADDSESVQPAPVGTQAQFDWLA